MKNKLFDVIGDVPYRAGLHNIGYVIAFVIWLTSLFNAYSQLHFESEFTMLARKTICEQPLNNRCDYSYQVRYPNGQQEETNLTEFRGDENDLAIGNTIKKFRWSFDYFVNGRRVTWKDGQVFALLSIAALIPFYLARRFT